MRRTLVLVAVIAGLALSACSNRAKRQSAGGADSADDSSSMESSSSSGGSRSSNSGGSRGSRGGSGSKGGAAGGVVAGPDADAASRIVYFEYDSDVLTGDGAAIVEAWGQYLSSNPGAKIRLEGHCDERGTREYNIGLGERRANTVLAALTSRGVGAGQLAVTSSGEERPVALGHDEAAWGQNRRVELMQ